MGFTKPLQEGFDSLEFANDIDGHAVVGTVVRHTFQMATQELVTDQIGVAKVEVDLPLQLFEHVGVLLGAWHDRWQSSLSSRRELRGIFIRLEVDLHGVGCIVELLAQVTLREHLLLEQALLLANWPERGVL